jgi:hypothetical protein
MVGENAAGTGWLPEPRSRSHVQASIAAVKATTRDMDEDRPHANVASANRGGCRTKRLCQAPLETMRASRRTSWAVKYRLAELVAEPEGAS